jgi:AraC-like DNA-binding protein
MGNIFENLSCNWSINSERNFVTPTNEVKSFLFYAQETGIFSTYKGYLTERRGLNSFLILHTSKGQGTLIYDNVKYQLKSGDVFFIDCTAKHKYFNQSNEPWDFEWIHFNGPNLQGCFNYFHSQNQGVVAHTNNDNIKNLLIKLNDVNKNQYPQSDFITFNLLSQLLSELFLLNTPTLYKINSVPKYLLQIINEIDKTFCDKLSLEELAKKFNLNAFTLSRNFKKHFGMGIKAYITKKRMSYAKELLRYTDKSISEISEILSYENDEYFIALFKSYERLTPLSFRKKWQVNK